MAEIENPGFRAWATLVDLLESRDDRIRLEAAQTLISQGRDLGWLSAWTPPESRDSGASMAWVGMYGER